MATIPLGRISFNPRGEYAASASYIFLDLVYNPTTGCSYCATQASTGIEPGVTNVWASYWMMFGKKGDTGDTGVGLTILGNYETLAELEAAVTNPNIGDAYGVGTQAPYDIYIYSANGWVNHGSLEAAEVIIQYSTDATTWSTTYTSGDRYMRFSTDGGTTWGSAMLFSAVQSVDGVAPGADGDIPLGAARQVTEMPTDASANDVVQWIGDTSYTFGHWYKFNGTTWVEIVYGDPNSVSYDLQTGKSEDQKLQSRENIGIQYETLPTVTIDNNGLIATYVGNTIPATITGTVGVLTKSSTVPVSPVSGDKYIDTSKTTPVLQTYNSPTWVESALVTNTVYIADDTGIAEYWIGSEFANAYLHGATYEVVNGAWVQNVDPNGVYIDGESLAANEEGFVLGTGYIKQFFDKQRNKIYPRVNANGLDGAVSIANGGTGATTETGARTALGAANADVFSRATATSLPANTKGIDVGVFNDGISLGIGTSAPESSNNVGFGTNLDVAMRKALGADANGLWPVSLGGTGAENEAAARTSLDVPEKPKLLWSGSATSGASISDMPDLSAWEVLVVKANPSGGIMTKQVGATSFFGVIGSYVSAGGAEFQIQSMRLDKNSGNGYTFYSKGSNNLSATFFDGTMLRVYGLVRGADIT